MLFFYIIQHFGLFTSPLATADTLSTLVGRSKHCVYKSLHKIYSTGVTFVFVSVITVTQEAIVRSSCEVLLFQGCVWRYAQFNGRIISRRRWATAACRVSTRPRALSPRATGRPSNACNNNKYF